MSPTSLRQGGDQTAQRWRPWLPGMSAYATSLGDAHQDYVLPGVGDVCIFVRLSDRQSVTGVSAHALGGYPYAASFDAEVADPDVHRVLSEDERIMFLVLLR